MTAQANRAFVLEFYQGAQRGDMSRVVGRMREDFVCSAPRYLPWGGDSEGRARYLEGVLPQVGAFLDFAPFSYDSLTVEADHAVALINVGVRGTSHRLKISEHFDFDDGMATRIWVAYYEPGALLDAIAAAA